MRAKVRNFARVWLQNFTADNCSPRAETRQDLVVHSSRWAGRSPSQQLRRKVWTPPDLDQEPLPSNTISHYSDQNYVIGDSSNNRLKRMAHRLVHGPSPAPTRAGSPGQVKMKDSAENIRQKFAQAELPDTSIHTIFELPGYVPASESKGVPVYRPPAVFADDNASEGSYSVHPAERDSIYSSSPPNDSLYPGSGADRDTISSMSSYQTRRGKQREVGEEYLV